MVMPVKANEMQVDQRRPKASMPQMAIKSAGNSKPDDSGIVT
jgi:hypothetical protein